MIVVEDGSIVANANSLVSEADYVAYLTAIDVVPTGNTEIQLIQAMEYIDSLEPVLMGRMVKRGQALAFPRIDLCIEGFYWSSSEIPRQAIDAQIALALDLENGIDLYNRPEPDNKVVKRERVEGAVEVEYATPSNGVSVKVSKSSRSMALVSLLKKNSGLFLVRS